MQLKKELSKRNNELKENHHGAAKEQNERRTQRKRQGACFCCCCNNSAYIFHMMWAFSVIKWNVLWKPRIAAVHKTEIARESIIYTNAHFSTYGEQPAHGTEREKGFWLLSVLLAVSECKRYPFGIQTVFLHWLWTLKWIIFIEYECCSWVYTLNALKIIHFFGIFYVCPNQWK